MRMLELSTLSAGTTRRMHEDEEGEDEDTAPPSTACGIESETIKKSVILCLYRHLVWAALGYFDRKLPKPPRPKIRRVLFGVGRGSGLPCAVQGLK